MLIVIITHKQTICNAVYNKFRNPSGGGLPDILTVKKTPRSNCFGVRENLYDSGPFGDQQAGDSPDQLIKQYIGGGEQFRGTEITQCQHNDQTQNASQ